MNSTKELYEKISKENVDVNVKDVKRMFLWYDLLGFGLSFQLLFISSYVCNWKYAITTFSCLFIILVDAMVKEVLDKDPKNYIKLKNELPLVKLWALPLVCIATISTAALIFVELFF